MVLAHQTTWVSLRQANHHNLELEELQGIENLCMLCKSKTYMRLVRRTLLRHGQIVTHLRTYKCACQGSRTRTRGRQRPHEPEHAALRRGAVCTTCPMFGCTRADRKIGIVSLVLRESPEDVKIVLAGEVGHAHGAARDRASQSMQLCSRVPAVQHVACLAVQGLTGKLG